jgi:hypothetical protein
MHILFITLVTGMLYISVLIEHIVVNAEELSKELSDVKGPRFTLLAIEVIVHMPKSGEI